MATLKKTPKKKTPKDINKLAASIVAQTTGESPPKLPKIKS
jgi:hypothetical protein